MKRGIVFALTLVFLASCFTSSELDTNKGDLTEIVASLSKLQLQEDQALSFKLTVQKNGQPIVTGINVEQPSSGVLEISEDGTVSYVPAPNYFGNVTFRASATVDGQAVSGSFTFVIAAVNDAPVAMDDSYSIVGEETLANQLRATDIDSTSLRYSLTRGAGQGTVEITDSETGKFTYSPAPGAQGDDSFEFEVSDGAKSDRATVHVLLNANDDHAFITWVGDSWIDQSPVSLEAGKLLQIKNTGKVSATNVRFSIQSPFWVNNENVAGGCQRSIRPGETCKIQVFVHSNDPGVVEKVLSVHYFNASQDVSYQRGISWNGLARANLKFDAASIELLQALVLQSDGVTGSVRVTNTGDLKAKFTDETIESPLRTVVVPYTNNCANFTELLKNQSCFIAVTFNSASPAQMTREISLSYSDSVGEQSVSLPVNIRAVAAPVLVAKEDSSANFNETPVVAFGQKIAAGAKVERVVTLKNASETALGGLRFVEVFGNSVGFKNGSYPGTGGTCGNSLPAQGECSVVLVYSADISGDSVTGGWVKLRYVYADAFVQDLRIRISGSTVYFGAVNMLAQHFGARVPGSRMTQKLLVSAYPQDLGVTHLSYHLSGPFKFAGNDLAPGTDRMTGQVGNCGDSLASGSQCNLFVDYVPSGAGLQAGTLSIAYHNGHSTTTETFNLTGTATDCAGADFGYNRRIEFGQPASRITSTHAAVDPQGALHVMFGVDNGSTYFTTHLKLNCDGSFNSFSKPASLSGLTPKAWKMLDATRGALVLSANSDSVAVYNTETKVATVSHLGGVSASGLAVGANGNFFVYGSSGSYISGVVNPFLQKRNIDGNVVAFNPNFERGTLNYFPLNNAVVLANGNIVTYGPAGASTNYTGSAYSLLNPTGGFVARAWSSFSSTRMRSAFDMEEEDGKVVVTGDSGLATVEILDPGNSLAQTMWIRANYQTTPGAWSRGLLSQRVGNTFDIYGSFNYDGNNRFIGRASVTTSGSTKGGEVFPDVLAEDQVWTRGKARGAIFVGPGVIHLGGQARTVIYQTK